jgi:catechol 2,3-dioxygenase-like lactoylglutathione lyase family enzyme
MRVAGLLHYGLQVPDLDQGRDFYTAFGLETAERGQGLAVRCVGREQDQTLLFEGADKRLHHVAFAIAPGSLPRFQRHLETSVRVALLDPPHADLEAGLWFRDPDGNLVTLVERELAAPRPPRPARLNLPGDYQRVDEARWLSASEAASPRRLGHMLIFTADLRRAEEFYAAALGLRTSDRIPDLVAFMNAGPGDHHVFGLIQSDHSGLHHSSWEVDTIDQLGMGAHGMAEQGHRVGWGLGRHSLGSNLFHYIRDPWGSWIEYFADIDQITEAWTPREWHTPPAVWCPVMPADFLTNLEPKAADSRPAFG